MTNEQLTAIRQKVADLKAAYEAALPTGKTLNVSLNYDAQQVTIQWGFLDPSLNSPSAVGNDARTCKFTDMPPAQ